jgi:hypothetical protein
MLFKHCNAEEKWTKNIIKSKLVKDLNKKGLEYRNKFALNSGNIDMLIKRNGNRKEMTKEALLNKFPNIKRSILVETSNTNEKSKEQRSSKGNV